MEIQVYRKMFSTSIILNVGVSTDETLGELLLVCLQNSLETPTNHNCTNFRNVTFNFL